MADGFGLAQLNASSGGKGWIKAINKPVPLFLQDDFQHLIAGAGGVLMSGHDSVTWLQTLLLGGRHPKTGEQMISEASIRRAISAVVPQASAPQFPEFSTPIYGAAQWQYSFRGHNLVEHTGGFTGWHSVISRSIDDGLGIAIFTNWEHGTFIMHLIKMYLYEKSLGIPHINWSARYRALLESSLVPASQTVKSAVTNVEKYAGVYTNPGYGTIVLCPTNTTALVASKAAANCSAPLAQAEIVASKNLPHESPDLVALVQGPIFNHLQLTHVSGHTFKSSHFEVTNEPISQSSVVLPAYGLDFDSEFVLDEDSNVCGIAWTGNIWLAGPDVEPVKGKTAKDRAEVFWKLQG